MRIRVNRRRLIRNITIAVVSQIVGEIARTESERQLRQKLTAEALEQIQEQRRRAGEALLQQRRRDREDTLRRAEAINEERRRAAREAGQQI